MYTRLVTLYVKSDAVSEGHSVVYQIDANDQQMYCKRTLNVMQTNFFFTVLFFVFALGLQIVSMSLFFVCVGLIADTVNKKISAAYKNYSTANKVCVCSTSLFCLQYFFVLFAVLLCFVCSASLFFLQ